MERRRVHFAGVGFREWERVTFPLQELRADLVYLFDHQGPTPGDRRSQQQVELIQSWCKKNKIGFEDVQVDLWDTAEVVARVGELVDEEPRAEFRFNVSTGPKPCLIGGVFASMFYPIKPYYVRVNYAKERPATDPSQYPPESVAFIPTFRLQTPRPEAIEALRVLADNKGALDQQDLAAALKSRGVIRPKKATELSPQAAYSQVKSILRGLEVLGFVERSRGMRGDRIQITDEGAAGRRMFRRLLEARK